MPKRISRKDNKSPVIIEVDKDFEAGFVYFALFEVELKNDLKKQYKTAYSIRNQEFRIKSTLKRMGIKDLGKVKTIKIHKLKKLSEHE